MDSYSGFYVGENGVELRDKLNELNVKEVYVCGLAFDFCVGSTALDAKKYGFTTYIIQEGTKSVSKPTAEAMEDKLNKSGIPMISFESVNCKWWSSLYLSILSSSFDLTDMRKIDFGIKSEKKEGKGKGRGGG